MANTSILYNLIHGNNLVSFPFISVVGTHINTPDGLMSRITGSNGSSSISGIIGQGKACTILTSSNTVFGSLDNIDPEKGYWLTISGARQIGITGELIEPNYHTNLDTGNNLVSFPFGENQTLEDVLNDISGSNFSSIIGAGTAAQVNSGNWIGSLASADNLTTGSAFWLRTTVGQEGTYTSPWHSPDTDVGQTASSSFDYIPCNDGHQGGGLIGEPGDYFSAQGVNCRNTVYFQNEDGVDAVPEIHSFGYRAGSTSMHFMFFKDRHFSSASLVRADGTEISQSSDGHPPIVGFYTIPVAGPNSGSTQNLECVGTGTWPSTNPDYSTSANESSSFADSGSHLMTVPIILGADNAPNQFASQDFTKPLIVRVYDPHRARVYSARVYNENHVETPLSGSQLGTVLYLGANDSTSVTNHGWRYIKTDI